MPADSTAKSHDRLRPIDGSPPDLFAPPQGCGYFARCPHAMRICEADRPVLLPLDAGHAARCWLHHSSAQHRVDRIYTAPVAGRARR
jgi:oligopeptide transport system ATP-binding protein